MARNQKSHKGQKKVYFYTHTYDAPHTIYYMWMPESWNDDLLNIGYNDPYEMRSQYVEKPYFSDNYEDIKKIAELQCKKEFDEALAELIRKFQPEIKESKARECDGFMAP